MESYPFITLLMVTLIIAGIISVITAMAFRNPIAQIMDRLVAPEIAHAWTHYLRFAILVVGISGGVQVYRLENYADSSALTRDQWVLELYRCAIGTLGNIAWMLLVFFVFALVAYVIVRALELKRQAAAE